MTQTTYPKRLIEVDLPIKRISAHARREKSIRHGHISTLHIWWARRPLAACRAVICAALWFDPADENCPREFREAARREMHKWARDHRGLMSAESYEHFEAVRKKPALLDGDDMLRTLLLDFIADFANWDNSTRREYLETSRALTEAAHVAAGGEPGTRPLVVDPFAGGGAIPLEALRVGADAFASDLNPVAVLLNKVVLEYIPRYGEQLADEVKKWGAWVKERAQKELAEFYPPDRDGALPIAYLWARTAKCEGPGCGAEVPLMRSLLLAKRDGQSIALKMNPDQRRKQVDFDIVNVGENLASSGTLRRGSVTCPVCGYSTPGKNVRLQFKGKRGGADTARLLAVVCDKNGARFYREPLPKDYEAFAKARERRKVLEKIPASGLSQIPNERLPYLRSIFNINLLDVNEWGEMFSARQAVALVTLCSALSETSRQIQSRNPELVRAVTTLLAFAIDRQADYCTSICTWVQSGEFIGHNFAQGQSLPIKWDFAEVVPLSVGSGNWDGAIDWIARVIMNLAQSRLPVGHAERGSATQHVLSDDSVSAFITDPPYYDAIPYADLSDFFYVWLKRSIGRLYPDLFTDELTPKREEVVQLAERNIDYSYKTKENFESLMREALAEGRRITRPGGIGIFVFAHKGTAAWETMLQAVLDAGWVATASWSIDTEMGARLRAKNAAALASSVHIVCRPRENADGALRADDVGDWRDVLRELPIRIHEWMPRLAAEGVVGADAIFACLGPALEIFSRYSRVEKASGEQVTLRDYLEYVWAAVAKEALTMIFAGARDADVSGFEADARLTAMWLWTLSAGVTTDADESVAEAQEEAEDDEETPGKSSKSSGFTLEYDAARKIAQGLGAHLEELTQLVEVKGDKARLLPVAERTKYLFGKEEAQAPRRGKKREKQAQLFDTLDDVEVEMGGWGDKSTPQLGDTVLDRVHQAMILFAAGRGDAMRRFLVDDGVGNDERFWRLANALSALYPSGGDEKRWVDGVLARKKGLGF